MQPQPSDEVGDTESGANYADDATLKKPKDEVISEESKDDLTGNQQPKDVITKEKPKDDIKYLDDKIKEK